MKRRVVAIQNQNSYIGERVSAYASRGAVGNNNAGLQSATQGSATHVKARIASFIVQFYALYGSNGRSRLILNAADYAAAFSGQGGSVTINTELALNQPRIAGYRTLLANINNVILVYTKQFLPGDADIPQHMRAGFSNDLAGWLERLMSGIEDTLLGQFSRISSPEQTALLVLERLNRSADSFGDMVQQWQRETEGYRALRQLDEFGLTRFRIVGEVSKNTCDSCKRHIGNTYTLQEITQARLFPPFHPNCRCRLQVAKDEAQQNPERELEVDAVTGAAPKISGIYAYRLGISEEDLEDIKASVSMTDILFVDNLIYQYSNYFGYIPTEDEVFSALYVVKNYDEKTAREMLKTAVYQESYFLWADFGEIGHILTAYGLAQRGERSA